MEQDKKLNSKNERTSGESGSVEEMGFGHFAQKHKRNEGKKKSKEAKVEGREPEEWRGWLKGEMEGGMGGGLSV